MVKPTNHVIARAEFTSRGTLGTLRIFARSSFLIQVKTTKKVLPSERWAPGPVKYDKFFSWYCITFIKILDEGLRFLT